MSIHSKFIHIACSTGDFGEQGEASANECADSITPATPHDSTTYCEENEDRADTKTKCRIPVGLNRAKEDERKKHVVIQILRLAQDTLVKSKRRKDALNVHIEIILFIDGPSGADSAPSQEHFSYLQGEALQKMQKNVICIVEQASAE